MTYAIECTLSAGLIDTERIALVLTAEGHEEEVTVNARSVESGLLPVGYIGERDGNVLVELPRESARGYWRLWVARERVHRQAESVAR